ncbi:MAG: ribonuclease P protein component [Deltaproteobacteria bacterium]|nr:ribonuclease P protein component [Deltaproteobacteria bacterium]
MGNKSEERPPDNGHDAPKRPKNFRFTKSERLLKRGEFRAVSRNYTRRINNDHLLLLLKPNQLPQTRLGIIASKKVGSAVKRNRVKRIIREFFRTNKLLLPPRQDLLVIVHRSAGDADAGVLNHELERMIKDL